MSEDEAFGQLLHGTARAWRQKLDERLKPLGLSQAKWRTLLHLSIAQDALTQAEIAAGLVWESPQSSRYCIGWSGRLGLRAQVLHTIGVVKWCCSAGVPSG